MKKKYPIIICLALIAILFVAIINFRAKAAEDEDITISSNATWAAGTYNYRDIIITNNATLTLNGSYTNDEDGAGVVINARNISLEVGSSITATGKGYATGTGPGKGAVAGMYGSGGSYGGKGGISATSTPSGPVYGLVTDPVHLGSGGSGATASGGGAIILNLTGNLIAEGNISANGLNGGSFTGGGSGGTIKITAVDISGVGTISANGGNGGASGGGAGGGGRIAVYYTGTKSKENSKFSASAGTTGGAGGVGSVFVYDRTSKDSTVFSSITLDANEGIGENGLPTSGGVYNFRNLTINNNASLFTKTKYATDTDGVGIELKLTGDLSIDAGSKIDGKGLGYPIGVGQGKPAGSANTYGGGGGHGGNGGRGELGNGGIKYGSTMFPITPGSGGYTTKGGAGGSAVKITANDIIISGSIDNSATNGTLSGSIHGSGAAGGSVYIIANTISGAGTIKADGSNAVGSSGGGAGGRIAIYGDISGFNPVNITANKGLKGGGGNSADGEIGTVFLYDTATGNVNASSDVMFEATQGVNPDGTVRDDGVFYFNNLSVTNNSTVTIGSYYTNDSDGRGVTINLDGDLTIEEGSQITAAGQGYAGDNGLGKGNGTSSTSGSGGSYGGLGGKSFNNDLASAVYDVDKANYPHALGSGGGGGTGVGGKGGGAITLRVLGSIINNGSIDVNGASGSGGISAWKPGGGSGGSIFINCESLSGTGTITSDGGDGQGSADFGSGGGGGGRIAIVYGTDQNMQVEKITAAGGTGSLSPDRDGASGTVVITKRTLPAAEFELKNPNNDSTEYTNSENVEIVPTDGSIQKYKEASSPTELVPVFYAPGWKDVAEEKTLSEGEGEKTVRAWLKDQNELIASSIGTATIILDKTNPSIEITNNNQETENAILNVVLTLEDVLSGIDYVTVNGEQVEIEPVVAKNQNLLGSETSLKIAAAKDFKIAQEEPQLYQVPVDLSVGNNSIEIIVYDRAGNYSSDTLIANRTTPAPEPGVDDNDEPDENSDTVVDQVSTSEEDEAQSGNEAGTDFGNSLSQKISEVIENIFNSNDKEKDTESKDNSQETDRSSTGQVNENNSLKNWIVLMVIIIALVLILLIVRQVKKSNK